eukprot:COSAG06_NODE_3622_length_5106_cov_4.627721_7_plen_267_part_00
MKALKGGALGDIHDLEDFKLYVEPGDFGGDGLWSDLKSEVKKVQKNPIARKLEKKAVSYGAKALRGIAEGAADGIGDTAATFVGVPEIAAPLDAAIDRGLSSVQKAGTKYLRDIGRDVASSLGEELKGVAKEKATSFVKEQFGLGFKDELKSTGREILSAVGSELTGAAKEKATSMIKEQLGLGMDGGAIAKPCSISVTQLRKAVTAARKANHITGKANREQLMAIGEGHADLGGRHAAAVVSTRVLGYAHVIRRPRSAVSDSYLP